MPRTALKVSDVPELMRLWASEENEAEALHPALVHANASIQCWWRCEEGHLTRRLAISKKVNPICGECTEAKLARTLEESLARCYPELAAEWDSEANLLRPDQVTPGSGRSVWWKCKEGHRWKAAVGRRASGRADCGVCANRVLLVGYNDLATRRPDLVREWDDEIDPQAVLFNSSRKVQWKCSKGHVWRTQIGFRTREGKRGGSGCGQCSKRVSQGENEVAEFIESLGYSLTRSDRRLIHPYELDITDIGLNFAVEYNGVYWHSESQIQSSRGMSAREYHATKKKKCEEKAITLLFVWQDDWESRRQLVEDALVEFFSTGRATDILSRLDPKDTLP